MLKESLERLKEKFKKEKTEETKTNSKKVENLVVFIIILIITIIIINSIWNNKNDNKEEKQDTGGKILASNQNETNTPQEEINALEGRLERILANIQGVGKVKVLITYSQSSQTMAMYNEDSTQSDTNEEDSQRR